MAPSNVGEDNFVAIDMESLSLIAAPTDEQPSSSHIKVQTNRSFSRKGSNRGSERKAADGVAATLTTNITADEACAESAVPILIVSGDQGSVSPTIGKCKRLSKRCSPWRDPRRVVMMFATLSSIGTLILLYLTLSMVGGEASQK